MEERRKVEKMLIGGDFNVKTGANDEGIVKKRMSRKEEEKIRRSKGGKVNLIKEGRTLIEFIEEKGWSIYIGVVKRDEKGEYRK